MVRGRRRDLGPIDRHDPHLHQPRPSAEREHAAEQLGNRLLVTRAEARDGRVVGSLIGRDHPEGNIVAAAPLDRARRTHTERIRVNEQRHHHLRIVRSGPPAVTAISRVERLQIKLRHALEHEPGQVVLGQPLAPRRRQQQMLITIARQEVLGHHAPHRSGTTASSPSAKTEQPPQQSDTVRARSRSMEPQAAHPRG